MLCFILSFGIYKFSYPLLWYLSFSIVDGVKVSCYFAILSFTWVASLLTYVFSIPFMYFSLLQKYHLCLDWVYFICFLQLLSFSIFVAIFFHLVLHVHSSVFYLIATVLMISIPCLENLSVFSNFNIFHCYFQYSSWFLLVYLLYSIVLSFFSFSCTYSLKFLCK